MESVVKNITANVMGHGVSGELVGSGVAFEVLPPHCANRLLPAGLLSGRSCVVVNMFSLVNKNTTL